MRFASYQHEDTPRWGLVEGDHIRLAPRRGDCPQTLLAFIERKAAERESILAAIGEHGELVPLLREKLLAPIPRPAKNVICLGLNYAAHAAESFAVQGRQAKLPEHPVVFTKAVTSVTGPYARIPLDTAVTEQLDWEVELALVIGKGGRHIPEEQALDHVFGYTVLNDLSMRDLQFRHKQFFLGKSMDQGCPMGPWLLSADQVPDPQNLTLRCRVDGALKQEGHTRDQIFSVARTIAILSQSMTLEPGDIIATGTPDGVGFARTPPEFLQAGSVVECEVEGIGVIRNTVVDA
ncbi:fumarylacetoacetate hydrolase family protein [Alkalilimnicola sp. S0819]|uniref:fumarylacetoacetate hydrolase family protein n=1 Tax=Alkalilimnicola sp. S0819 TaxID=2613922 RepID=UPI001261CBDB|nr:fumarylacetoacetate hydrolase family protein [Alkalilimnicola sp. S0819]KAB7619703.1 fumarylacetoacetate hydrolase family protein [Alkalilimnicola sp. S0819]MPQ17561.1 DUF2437 domain-containing protein [Alkalilimnicola sp. S0819]